ncbi:hypothetical protein BASA81_002641 [Batrachochytrium salamandrivorans]|nr:hypothetical protein BASA81_002641 [Batrachochytrium salamandrivorans]
MYTCSGCNYSTKVRSNVAKHIKTVTKCFGSELITTVNKVQCPNCSKEFENEMYLKQHQPRCKVVTDNHPLSEETNTPSDLHDQVKLLGQTVDRLLRSHVDLEEQVKKQQEQIIKLTKLCAGKQTDKQIEKPVEKAQQANIIEYRKCDQYLEKNDAKTHERIFLKAIKSEVPIVTLIESLFFDEKLPRFHCMCIKNRRTDEIKLFEDKCWQSKKAGETVGYIITHCQNTLNEWATVVDKNNTKYSYDDIEDMEPDPFEKDKKAYNKREERKGGEDYDASEDTDVVDSVLELLYNKRDMIKC